MGEHRKAFIVQLSEEEARPVLWAREQGIRESNSAAIRFWMQVVRGLFTRRILRWDSAELQALASNISNELPAMPGDAGRLLTPAEDVRQPLRDLATDLRPSARVRAGAAKATGRHSKCSALAFTSFPAMVRHSFDARLA